MDDTQFWKLIATIDGDALEDGDDEGAVAPLQEALTALAPAEIEAFEEALAQKLYAIDGRAFSAACSASGGSDDGFLYARCYVVARGRKHYDTVKANPLKMPTSEEEWCEALLSVAEQAYEEATGKGWDFVTSVSYETGSNKALWRQS